MPTTRSVRAAVEGGQVHLQLPGHDGLLSLSPVEAASLARQLRALPEVEAIEVEATRQLLEDYHQEQPWPDDDGPALVADPPPAPAGSWEESEGIRIAERQARERYGDG